ncbi:MAG: hypothetical protein NWE93_06695 [Candidatus Bathyarchaeota archaeon]|nr:hypothetical protein [Candidatus Bathyarchaeota archaeon]
MSGKYGKIGKMLKWHNLNNTSQVKDNSINMINPISNRNKILSLAEVDSHEEPNTKQSHKNRNIAIAIIAAAILAITAVGFFMNATALTSIPEATLQLQYGQYDQGDFGATTQTVFLTDENNNDFKIQPGQQFWITFTLSESSLSSGDNSISEITTNTPGFSVTGTDPSTPITFSPGASQEIKVYLQSPQTVYNGAINLILTTSGGSPPVTQVKIKVDYNGEWSGAYTDVSTLQSWNGNGDYSIVLDRPNDGTMWIVTANAMKLDGTSKPLTVSILKMDGTILKTSSTSTAYGMAQVTTTIS